MYPLLTPAHPTSAGRNESKEVVPNVTSKRHVRHAQHQTKCHPERREGSAFHASAPKTAPHPARTTPAANPPFVSARPPPCRNIAKERGGLEGRRFELARPPRCSRNPTTPPPRLIFIKSASGFAPQPPRRHIFPQQRTRPVLRIPKSSLQHVQNIHAHIQPDKIRQLQRPHRMIHPQLHHRVHRFRSRHSLHHRKRRLIDQRHQHAVRNKPRRVVHRYRLLLQL